MKGIIKNKTSRIPSVIILPATVIVLILLALLHFRIDLTEDQRYTLSPQTKKILSNLDKEVLITVYLDGDMPIGFKKLRRTTEQYLDEFRVVSHRKVSYRFVNPSGGTNEAARQKVYDQLIGKGLIPVNVLAGDSEGGKSQKMVFPSMTINCNKVELPVNFLKNDPSVSADMNLIHSAEGLEYEIVQAIATATYDSVRKVAFIEGHGELDELQVADATMELAKYFTVDRGSINGAPGILDSYSAVIIAKPEKEFNEKDKFVLDQYLMNGGRILWLAEEVRVNSDSLVNGGTVAFYQPLNFEDQLFRYGVRINPVLLQDQNSLLVPVRMMNGGSRTQYVPAPWIYDPFLKPSPTSPVTRNLVEVKSEFVNSIDTVGRDGNIRKTILLTTGNASRVVAPPRFISLSEVTNPPSEAEFNLKYLPAAVLLEGSFQSAFKNRITSEYIGGKDIKVLEESKPTRMIVVADGDVIKNDVRYSNGQAIPLSLGLDRYTQQTFGNKEFIVNCVNYLVDDNNLLVLRDREIKPRLLDSARIKNGRIFWQVINTLLPLALIIIAGFSVNIIRRKRFTSVR
ncbi:MAG TPA: gliding motility-associated ABC transporter substrate-binding protein GldG [Bacteroidales bacterium]|nr:gliding motility-associated ABC transporter substrate-binding protein GldG [Bacteroidales bacterium]